MQSKTKGQKGQVKEREQRRQKKLEKQRRQGKGTAHGPRPTRDQTEVARRLLAGEVSMVGGTGWSFVEPFLAFLGELGFYELIQIDGERFMRKMMAVSLLILTYEVKGLLGLAGMNCVGKTLFRDIALLKLIGYSTRPLQEGFCQRVLLLARGFLDGLSLWQIKNEEGVDFGVPVKTTMNVTQDARAFLKQKPDDKYLFAAERAGEGDQQSGHVKLIGIRDLTSYDQYGDEEHQQQSNRADFEGNSINAIVVTEFDQHVYAADKAKVFLTSLPVNAPLTVIDLYDLRSLIENTLFRELKQGWFLGVFPKKTADAVRGHVFLTILVFNLTNAFRTHVGQDLAKNGIRRQRRSWHCNQVIIFAGDFYAVFDIETIFILLGKPPAVGWRVDPDQVYRQYASLGLLNPYGAI